jgi:hypothetical protein
MSCEFKGGVDAYGGQPSRKFQASAFARAFPVTRNIMNRRTVLIATTLLGSAITAPQAAFAQSSQWLVGTWKLNLAKSTYTPGPPPRSQTLTFETEAQGHRVTVETINAQGNPAKAVLIRHDDGKSYPVTGNAAAFDAEAFRTVNDSTAWVIRTKAGKVVTTIVAEMSADGKSFTDTITGVNADGQPFYIVAVREKQ